MDQRIRQVACQSIREERKETSYFSLVTISPAISDVEYSIFYHPFYLSSYEYQGRTYHFAVSGRVSHFLLGALRFATVLTSCRLARFLERGLTVSRASIFLELTAGCLGPNRGMECKCKSLTDGASLSAVTLLSCLAGDVHLLAAYSFQISFGEDLLQVRVRARHGWLQ